MSSRLAQALALGCGMAALVVVGCRTGTGPDGLPGWREPRSYATHVEQDVVVRSVDGALLSGTLYRPPDTRPHATIIMQMGSDRWTRLDYEQARGFVGHGMAVLSFDKRGVGRSQGKCCPWRQPGYFPLLAEDLLAFVREARKHPLIRPGQVGLWGFSQGGWVVPAAAAKAGEEIAFTIIGSGPAVTLGEELLFSELSGEAACTPSGLDSLEIERRMQAERPWGIDPRPDLERMRRPGLWIYGGLDGSIPVRRSMRNLERVRSTHHSPFDVAYVADINHVWIVNGGLCQMTGAHWDDSRVILPWLDEHVPGWR